MNKITILVLLMIGLFLGCSIKNQGEKIKVQESKKQTIKRGQLLSSEFIASISKDKINDYFPERKEMKGNIDDLPKYDIDLYKIAYGSIYQGKFVELSGLIVVPKKEGKVTHLQYHHGTLLPYRAKDGWGSQDAPSLYKGNLPKAHKEQYETRLNANYLGSYGYLVSLPDYAGYGVSTNLEHPYGVNTQLAKESVDMILATKKFAQNKNLSLNEGTFLSGWSEGGAVCVATQKLIESQYKDDIKLLAASSMSGMLNVIGNMKKILTEAPSINQDLGETMDFLLWTYYSYNKFSSKPVPFSQLFKMPVSNDLDVLKNRPSSIPSKVLKHLDKDTFDYIMKQANLNDLATWIPLAPLFLYQGTSDEVVPFAQNPKVALKYYKEHGGHASLQEYEGHSHASLGLLQLKDMIRDFKTLSNKIAQSYILKANFIPSIIIPVPIIAIINPISFPITAIRLFPSFLTIKSLKENVT